MKNKKTEFTQQEVDKIVKEMLTESEMSAIRQREKISELKAEVLRLQRAASENEKRDINMVAMEVIMNAGDGRDKIDEALAAMAEGKLDEVDKLLEEAEALIVKAHNAQTEVIQSQVSGESMEYSLLFVHAQDTVMTITTELRMTQKLLPIVKMLLNKKGD